MRRTFECPKCSEVNPSVTYHRFCVAVGWPFMNGTLREHLHLVCTRCGYDWTRKVPS